MSRPLQYALFFLILLTVLGGMHWYLWARLVRDPQLAEPWRRGLALVIALGGVSIPAGMFLSRLLPRPLPRGLPMAVFGWFGVAFLLASALLVADLLRWGATGLAWLWEAARRIPDPPADPERRLFLARAVASGAVAAAGGASLYGIRSATGPPQVTEVPVSLSRLPPALSGLTIAQVSDLHVGPTVGRAEVRRVVELVNGLRPDVVAITGDLVDGGVAELGEAIGELGRLRSRWGTYFVTGNHEYYTGAVEAWLEELRRLGVKVLRNERVSVGDRGPGGASIELAGIDDWRSRGLAPGHGPDLDRALAGRDPERSLVLLAHQPHGVAEAARAGVELQLSGHTHGGQIFPFSLLVGVVYRYAKGLYLHEEAGASAHVYVNRGTGYWGPPMRVLNPPEITKLVLG
ncbi:MAG TPA: metallophosphoesterase [Anaeromyxobacteraceae bacterium]|nr:metallophosphoesterase [Anaeromyxobacteraceae bacterium]